VSIHERGVDVAARQAWAWQVREFMVVGHLSASTMHRCHSFTLLNVRQLRACAPGRVPPPNRQYETCACPWHACPHSWLVGSLAVVRPPLRVITALRDCATNGWVGARSLTTAALHLK
jgi:hypothetical protein